ncbi:hypothetical protein A2U01_0061463, partial [Trifolium medium]|nr:hypothetical protein [Trifolium medium]
SASARRKKAAENPPKKRARKRTAEAEAETAHTAPEHHEGEPAQANVTKERHYGDDVDDIVRDMEEEMERKGDGVQAKVRRPVWVNPYEGQPEPEVFPGGLMTVNYMMFLVLF